MNVRKIFSIIIQNPKEVSYLILMILSIIFFSLVAVVVTGLCEIYDYLKKLLTN